MSHTHYLNHLLETIEEFELQLNFSPTVEQQG